MASRTLSDPLTLLREYTTAKRSVTLEGDHVVFGRTRFLRTAKTAYRSGTNGDGEYYAVDSVWSLLQHGQGGAGDYAKACGLNGITPIRFPDRRKLLAYLKGEESDSRCVDYSNYETVQPVGVDASGEAVEDSQVADDTMADFEVTREAREPKHVDPAQIEAGRAAFRRLLEVPKGVAEDSEAQAMEADSAGEPSEDAPAGGGAMEGEDAKAGEAGGKSAFATDAATASMPMAKGEGDGKQSAAMKERLKQAVSAAKPFIRFDRDQLSAIVKRERHMRSRATVLQAASSAGFPAVQAVLESFRKRNRAALAQKEKAKQQSGSGAAAAPLSSSGARGPSRDVPTSGHPMQPQPPRPTKSMSGSLSTHGGRPSSSASTSSHTCIFIVPAAITAIVNMYNVRELLEQGEYVPAADRKTAGATKEASINIAHTYDDGTRVKLRVLDNPQSALKAAEWDDVGAVLVQGTTWQFKGWPYAKGEAEIFHKMVGFAMRFSDEIPNQKTKSWAVTNLVFSKERTRKHEVGVMLSVLWAALRTFLARAKPHLLLPPAKVK